MWLSQKQAQTDMASQRTRGGCRVCVLLCRKGDISFRGCKSLRRRQPVLHTLSRTTPTFHHSSDKQPVLVYGAAL